MFCSWGILVETVQMHILTPQFPEKVPNIDGKHIQKKVIIKNL
jgi:hypothetical protein